MPHVISPDRLCDERSGLLVVDLQQRLLLAIPGRQSVVERTAALLQAADCLGIPAAATVQYPKGLGPIEPNLQQRLADPEEKLEFSAAGCRRGLDRWIADGRDQVVVVGIESHVCIEQTVLDLIAEGLKVFVVVDAIAARNVADHEHAVARMRSAGATVTTTEAVLFSWCGTADRPEFKTISGIVKSLGSSLATR